MAVCENCGKRLSLSKRRWCSERCRKLHYNSDCIECGQKTGDLHSKRCSDCAAGHSPISDERTQKRIDRETEILRLMERGLTNTQIAVRLGVSYASVTGYIRRMKERGVVIPWFSERAKPR